MGERPILIDTGSVSDYSSICAQLKRLGIEPKELALIVHTHLHFDHAGSSAKLAAAAGCPIAYHPGDQRLLDNRTLGPLRGVGLRGKMLAWCLRNVAVDSMAADVVLHDGLTLNEYGCDAIIRETPGHTAGSVSIILANGDAIIGDVIMGGYLGGYLMPTKPNLHYFAEDLSENMRSLDKILSETTGTLYVGHGGPLAHPRVVQWL